MVSPLQISGGITGASSICIAISGRATGTPRYTQQKANTPPAFFSINKRKKPDQATIKLIVTYIRLLCSVLSINIQTYAKI